MPVAWSKIVTAGLLASAFSTLDLVRSGRRDIGSRAAPLNAVSHWLWPVKALERDDLSIKHTLTSIDPVTVNLLERVLLFEVAHFWLLAGSLDTACYRHQHLEHITGTSESLLHLVMLLELGPAVLVALLFELNAADFLVMYTAHIAHVVTIWWDLAHAESRRCVPWFEQWCTARNTLFSGSRCSCWFCCTPLRSCRFWKWVRRRWTGGWPSRPTFACQLCTGVCGDDRAGGGHAIHLGILQSLHAVKRPR